VNVQPFSVSRARSNGRPGMAPPSASPARRCPLQSGDTQSRIAALSLPAAAMTAPRCCTQTNVVVRQPDASFSTTLHTVGKSASTPPADTGPLRPYKPTSASVSRRSTGTASAVSVASAAGNRTSSASRSAVVSTSTARPMRAVRECHAHRSSGPRTHGLRTPSSAQPVARPRSCVAGDVPVVARRG
jgi:hypothetical protein